VYTNPSWLAVSEGAGEVEIEYGRGKRRVRCSVRRDKGGTQEGNADKRSNVEILPSRIRLMYSMAP
jgi:hypothetical protein